MKENYILTNKEEKPLDKEYLNDEFIILFHRREIEFIDKKIQSLLKKLNKVFKVEDYEMMVTVSIGIYIPNSNDKIDGAIRKAYIALYEAKKK